MNRLFAGVLFALLTQFSFAASFDCQKATTVNEKAICSNPTLSKLDDQLAATYKIALRVGNSDFIKSEQRSWIQSNKSCETNPDQTSQCLTTAYESRIDQLSQSIADNSGYLGAKFSDAHADSSGDGYVTATDVIFNGPAFTAGIKSGDQIVTVNGAKFKNQGDVASLVFVKPGTPISLGIRNDQGATRVVSVTPVTKDEIALLGSVPAAPQVQEDQKGQADNSSDKTATSDSPAETTYVSELTFVEICIIVLIGLLLYGLAFTVYLKYPKLRYLTIATPYDIGLKRELSEAEKITKSRRCIRELFYLLLSGGIFVFISVSAFDSENTNLIEATVISIAAFFIGYVIYIALRLFSGWSSRCGKCKNMFATRCTNSYQQPTATYEKRNKGFADGRDCHFVKVMEKGIKHADYECIVCGHNWHTTTSYERVVSEYHT